MMLHENGRRINIGVVSEAGLGSTNSRTGEIFGCTAAQKKGRPITLSTVFPSVPSSSVRAGA